MENLPLWNQKLNDDKSSDDNIINNISDILLFFVALFVDSIEDKNKILNSLNEGNFNVENYLKKVKTEEGFKEFLGKLQNINWDSLTKGDIKNILYTKSGLHFEDQKILDLKHLGVDITETIKSVEGAEKRNQMLKKRDKYKIFVKGVDLTVAEEKVIHAIQSILTQRNYSLDEGGFIEFTKSEFLTEYGLKRYKNKDGKYRFSGKAREIAFNSLKSLMEKNFFIFYELKYFNSKGDVRYEVIKEITPIFITAEYYGELTQEEKQSLYQGKNLDKLRNKINKIAIKPHRVLIDQVESNFVMKNKNYIAELENYTGKPLSKYLKNFINLLVNYVARNTNTKTKRNRFDYKLRRNYLTIATNIRMTSYIHNSQWKRIRKELIKFYDVAKELGYITDYKLDVRGTSIKVDELTLNPAKYYKPE
jgi:hypothetical protein